MQSSRFVGGFLSPDRWFSWRVAVAFIAIAASLLMLYKAIQRLFPNLFPKTWRRNSTRQRRSYSRIEFYEKIIKLLRSLGLRREPHQTPQEFLQIAGDALGRADLTVDMKKLSTAFYAKRFGENDELDPDQLASVQTTIKSLEDAIRNGLKKKIKSLSPS